MKKSILIGVLTFATIFTNAQSLQDFSLTNVVNDHEVSLNTFPSCEGLVFIFTSNACPYDEHYRERIRKLASTYRDKVPVVLVNANVEPAEAIPPMKAKSRDYGVEIPYLADKEQVLMKQLGATKSPQAFLVKNDNGKFTVVYSGAIDDNAQVEADVRHSYLKDAIEALIAGNSIKTAEVRPTGCTIRRK